MLDLGLTLRTGEEVLGEHKEGVGGIITPDSPLVWAILGRELLEKKALSSGEGYLLPVERQKKVGSRVYINSGNKDSYTLLDPIDQVIASGSVELIWANEEVYTLTGKTGLQLVDVIKEVILNNTEHGVLRDSANCRVSSRWGAEGTLWVFDMEESSTAAGTLAERLGELQGRSFEDRLYVNNLGRVRGFGMARLAEEGIGTLSIRVNFLTVERKALRTVLLLQRREEPKRVHATRSPAEVMESELEFAMLEMIAYSQGIPASQAIQERDLFESNSFENELKPLIERIGIMDRFLKGLDLTADMHPRFEASYKNYLILRERYIQ